MKKGYLVQRPWYDNGAGEDWESRWGYGPPDSRASWSTWAACREGQALLESYCRLCRRKR